MKKGDFNWFSMMQSIIVIGDHDWGRKEERDFSKSRFGKNNQFLFWSFLSPFRQRFSLPSHNNSTTPAITPATAATTDIEYDFQGE